MEPEGAEHEDVDVDDRLMTLLGRIHGAVVEFDREGRYQKVWTADPTMTPLPPPSLAGHDLVEVYGPDAEPLLALVQSVYDTGVAQRLDIELPMYGVRRWFAIDLKRIRRGDTYNVVAFRVDITERKRAEEALRLREERFRLAAEATNDVFYDRDLLSDTCAWGPSIGRVLGHPMELPVAAFQALVHPEDLSRAMADFSRNLEDPDAVSWQASYRLRRGDGTWADVIDRGTIVRDSERRPLRIVGSLSDVTQLNRLQMQLVQADRLAALGTLAAGVGHEINNPLSFVLGNLELALDAPSYARTAEEQASDAEVREALRDARDGALRIFEIVKGLRLFARSEPTTTGDVVLADVAERAIKICGNQIRHRARLVRAFGPTPPVRVNDAQLGQVCLNLLVNASQAIPLGEVEKHAIVVSTGVDQRGRAFLSVRDTGSGIAPEHLDRIFDPFFTTKAVGVGTGIGLSVCMNLVAAMGGELTVTSRPGDTVFTVSLPVDPSSRAAA